MGKEVEWKGILLARYGSLSENMKIWRNIQIIIDHCIVTIQWYHIIKLLEVQIINTAQTVSSLLTPSLSYLLLSNFLKMKRTFKLFKTNCL